MTHTLLDAHNFLSYDKETGEIRWSQHPLKKHRNGEIATIFNKIHGYLYVAFARKLTAAHRIAWLLAYGKMPDGVIDHINGIKTDNRLSNLRDVTQATNTFNRRSASKNNKTGLLGVSEMDGKYRARIGVNRKSVYLGYFNTADEARAAYLKAKAELHGIHGEV